MKKNITHRFQEHIKLLLFTLFFSFTAVESLQAQYSITGPTSVNQGQTYDYSILGSNIAEHNYTITGGAITGTGKKTLISVQWTAASSGIVSAIVEDTSFNIYNISLNVSIISPPPSTPSAPTISSNANGIATLQRASPPSGVTWFWQGISSNGISTSNSSTTDNVTSSGTYYLRARNNAGIWSTGSASVTVTVAALPTPTTPTIASNTNGVAILQRASPPSGVTWYWQGTSSSGSSTSNLSTTYNATSTGTYYLRAINSLGVWSTSSASVSVSIAPLLTWYQDQDSDGLGDINTTTTGYTQPTGYVANSNDQCPTTNGQGSSSGCVVSTSLTSNINENYVRTIVPQIATTDVTTLTTHNDKIETVTYFDGLGRTKQSVLIKGGKQETSPKDIVTHHEYDQYGRKLKDYLPYASSNSGNFQSGGEVVTKSYYKTNYAADFANTITANINPYSEKNLESSPLGRIHEQTAPGDAWKMGTGTITDKEYSDGHSIKFEYDTNHGNEVKEFSASTVYTSNNYYEPTLELSLSNQGFYPVNVLTKTITKDENWVVADGVNKTTEEFKNKSGQVVLKRTYNATVAHDTYYVYDNFGNLTYVIPPKVDTSDGVSASELLELCYQYKYDNRNRLVEKKIPGKGLESIVYDKLDRPILTQDSIQRAKSTKEWLFTKYDKLGRVIYTGLYKDNGARTALQTSANNSSVVGESKASSGGLYNYTNDAFPTIIPYYDVYTINYYDTHVYWTGDTVNPTTNSYGVALSSNTKGLSTTSKVLILGGGGWITTITGYDDKGRPIYVYSKNDYLQTTDIIENDLDDFTGKVLETKATHKKTGKSDIVTIDRFEYDHQNRLIAQTQKVDSNITERVVRNNYDELGQLESKLTGNGTQAGYKDLVGVSVSNDIITKTGAGGWNAGLATEGNFQGDGYVEFTAYQTSGYLMVGLSDTNTNASYSSIDYAIYTRAGLVLIYENAVNIGTFGSFYIDDVFKVERVGTTIYYKRNGKTFYTSTVSSSGTLIGDISFNQVNLKIKDLHIVDNNKGLQNVNYDYNVRGWLKNINQDANSDNDLFNFTLRYNNPTSGTALYNGNISQTSWNTLSLDNSTKTYTYAYDALNRITSGIDNTGDYNLTSVGYDKNGNILNLHRKGHDGTNVISGFMDDLSYTYDSGNKLTKVLDGGNTTHGFKDGANITTEYTYDVNGNMKTDANKGITNILYNHLNLPTQVTIGSQNITYTYDATGAKLRKVVGSTTTDYAGNHIYENGTLQFFNHAEGYVKYENSAFDYVYQYKDHLGNVRISYSDADGDGVVDTAKDTNGNGVFDLDLDGDGDIANEIIEESNYYPFGLKHKGYNNVTSSNGNSVAQKKLFNGKELEESLGLNVTEMDFRQYDNALGRFYNPDRLAAAAPSITPYRFGFNNPVYFSDPSGLWEDGNGGTTTSDPDEIRRFMSMLEIEQELHGGASKAQINKFVKEERQGSRGRLSDGSPLLDEVVVKGNSKTGKLQELNNRQVFSIGSQIEKFVGNPYNEKSFGFGDYIHGQGHWAYSYKYYREKSDEGFPFSTAATLMLSEVEGLMFGRKTWMGKNFKFYSQEWGGNGYTGGKNKFAKKWSSRIGTGLSVYGTYGLVRDYQNGQLSTMGAVYLGANEAGGFTGNPVAGAISFGTGLGQSIVETDWYFNAVYADYNW